MHSPNENLLSPDLEEAKLAAITYMEGPLLIIPGHGLYGGEKDGRFVKLMPVNRIATRADLNPLITGFDYRAFEKRQAEQPGQPVEKLTLICMGHEPDLAATLQKEVSYKLDVDVVDFHYDGAVLEPALVDLPGKDELVQGRYALPADAGTIRVKITDLLSESWEGELEGNR